MTYVQGMVAAVPEASREEYRRHSGGMGAVFRENGALGMVECWEADVPEGEATSFPKAVRRRQGEAVVFSWIVWPSRETCESALRRMRADGRFRCGEMTRLLDGKRLMYGGFAPLVEIRAEKETDMTYVQGMVAAVPEANREEYRRNAEVMGAVFRENGALGMTECWEVDVPEGKVTSFPMAVRRKEGEAIVFSWIRWPSKEVADAGMKEALARLRGEFEGMNRIYDGKRMIFGGFEVLVEV